MKEWSREVLAHNLRENMEARNINQNGGIEAILNF